MTKTSGGSLLESFVYTYDNVGNKRTMQEHRLYQSDLDIARCPSAPYSVSGLGSDCTFDTNPGGLSPSSQTVTVSLRAIGSVYYTYGGCPYSDTITWYVKVVTGGNTVTYNLGSQTASSLGGTFDLTKTAQIPVSNGQAVYGNISYSVICKSGVQPCVPIKGVDTTVLTIFYGADEGPVTYVYDKQYRLWKVTYADGTVGTYTYDQVGDRLTETGACPPCSLSYTYDRDHRLTQTITGGGVVESYAYDANGNERSHFASPHLTTYAYDYENRLVSVSETYEADDAGQNANGVEYTYRADPTDLVPSSQTVTLSLREVGTAHGAETITWYYVQKGVAVQMGSSYAVCSYGQDCPFDVTRTASATLTNGDTLYGEITFHDDSTHWVLTSVLRLTYAPITSVAATYRYSGDGLRTTVTTAASGTTYDAYDPMGSGGMGQPTGAFTSGTLTSQTVYGPGTDDPLSQTTSAQTYFLHADGQGSVTSVTNVSQGLQSSYRYDPYGAPVHAAGLVSSPYRYAGAQWDAGPGLTYDRARYYDPSTGRFLSKDPYGGGYAYAGDSPVNAADPSGKMFLEFSGAGGPPMSTGLTGGGAQEGAQSSPGLGLPQTLKCALGWTMFGIQVFFALIGLQIGADKLAQVAYYALTDFQWSALLTATGLQGVFEFVLSFGWWLFTNFILPHLLDFVPWWIIPAFIAENTPVGWGVKIIEITASVIMGLAFLHANGC